MKKNNNVFLMNDFLFSDYEVKYFSEIIRKYGIVEIENIFYPWVIEEAKRFIVDRHKKMKSSYVTFRSEDIKYSVFNEIKESVNFKKFLDRMAEEGGFPKTKDSVIHCVVRSIDGKKDINDQASHKYHFDAYDLTVSMPILIPEEKSYDSGDFVLFNRRRSTSSGLIKTLLYKVIFQNRFFRWIALSSFFFRLFEGHVVKIQPGSMYIFWGFRTYHGNKKIAICKARITALFHYSNPLSESRIIRLIEENRKKPQY